MKRRILSSHLPTSLLPLFSLFILVGLIVFSIGAEAGSQKRQRKLKKTRTHVVQTSRADKDTKKKASIRDDFDEYRSQEGGGEEENDDALARQNWFMFQRTYPSAGLPDEARKKAWDARPRPDRGLDFVSQAATGWTPIGPVGSLAYLPLRPNFGINSGRINAIAVSPVDPNLILIGASTGGIWRSTDGGAHFTPVSDSQTDLAVGGLAFAKSNSQIVYAGMGDAPDSVYFGTGVLKSTDAGLTWTKVSAQCASNAPTCLPTYGTTWKIETDANDANRVYIAQRSTKDSSGSVVRTIIPIDKCRAQLDRNSVSRRVPNVYPRAYAPCRHRC